MTFKDKQVSFWRNALELGEREFGPDHPTTATLLNNLATLYYAQGRYEAVEPLLKRALAIHEKALGPDHLSVATRLGIMYLGRIVEYGGCDEIFERPAHPYTEALVMGVPRPDPDKRRTLVSIEGEVPSLTSRPPGCEFHPRCKYVQARCRSEAPDARPLSDGRLVRCHFPLVA